MVHVHLALDHCNVAAVTFTMFWAIVLLLLAQHFVFSAFLTATLLLPLCGVVIQLADAHRNELRRNKNMKQVAQKQHQLKKIKRKEQETQRRNREIKYKEKGVTCMTVRRESTLLGDRGTSSVRFRGTASAQRRVRRQKWKQTPSTVEEHVEPASEMGEYAERCKDLLDMFTTGKKDVAQSG